MENYNEETEMDICSEEQALDKKLTFVPCVVDGGRLFRGFCYDLGKRYEVNARHYDMLKALVYDPVKKTTTYVNEKYLKEVDSIPEGHDEEVEYKEYLISYYENTISYYKNRYGSAWYPHCLDRFYRLGVNFLVEKFKAEQEDTRDLVEEITNIIQQTLTLRTGTTDLYGHRCAGGRKYSKSQYKQKALKRCYGACLNRLEGFKDTWGMLEAIYFG